MDASNRLMASVACRRGSGSKFRAAEYVWKWGDYVLVWITEV